MADTSKLKPPVPVNHTDSLAWLRLVADRVNDILNNGATNAKGTFTLTENDTTTTVTDQRAGTNSVILWMPLTANAAEQMDDMYVSDRSTTGQFTITHANSPETDQDFEYIIFG